MSNNAAPQILSADSSPRQQSSSRRHFLGVLARAVTVVFVSCAYVGYVFRMHEPIFWSNGLGDWIDPYFINALLEHWYRAAWNLSDPSSPPMFFPAAKTLGYSHGLVLYAPFYLLPRLVLHPFVAGSLALALVMETGIICLYLLLRRLELSFGEALLFTVFFFSSPNVVNGATAVWAQRLSVFLIPPILLLLVVGMERRTGWLAVGLASVTGLLATLLYAQDVYTAHFASLFLACGMIAVLAVNGGVKPAMLTLWRSQSAAMLVVLGITIAAAGWAWAIGAFGGIDLNLFGLRIRSNAWRRPAWLALIAGLAWLWMNRRMMRARVPRPGRRMVGFGLGALAGTAIVAWMYLGAFLEHGAFPEDQLLKSLSAVGPLSWSRPGEALQALRGYHSMRPFVLAVALTCLAWMPGLGVGKRLRRYWLSILAVSAIVLLIPFRFGDASVWRMLIEPLPGFGVIRDPLRIIYVYELALVVAITLLLARLPKKAIHRRAAMGLVVLLLAMTWNREVFWYARPIETFERWVAAPIAVDQACRGFYIKGASSTYMARTDNMWALYNIDAMFVAFKLGLPTLNGYSALMPGGWELNNPQEATYAGRVARWIGEHRLTGVCELDIETRVMRPAQAASSRAEPGS
jgi:uncharacterized membrane protein YqaE (UPF0057 family)